MAVFTIFYEHPEFGTGRYISTDNLNARLAIQEAKEMVPEKFAKNPDDAREMTRILDKMSIKAFEGRVATIPEKGRPAASHRPKA